MKTTCFVKASHFTVFELFCGRSLRLAAVAAMRNIGQIYTWFSLAMAAFLLEFWPRSFSASFAYFCFCCYHNLLAFGIPLDFFLARNVVILFRFAGARKFLLRKYLNVKHPYVLLFYGPIQVQYWRLMAVCECGFRLLFNISFLRQKYVYIQHTFWVCVCCVLCSAKCFLVLSVGICRPL